MDEMEFTEAESNMQDLVSEYQQCSLPVASLCTDALADTHRDHRPGGERRGRGGALRGGSPGSTGLRLNTR